MERYLLQDNVKPGSHLSVSARDVVRHIGVHWHNYIELELTTGGNGWQRVNGQYSDLKRGSLCLLRLTDFHELAPNTDLKLLNLSVDEQFLSGELLARLNSQKAFMLELDEEQTVTIEKLLNLCMDENTRQVPSTEYLQHLLACIMLQILKLVPNNHKPEITQDRPIQSALLYLHMHFRENPSLSKLAEIAHYNTSHFSTTFHKELGMTYTQYLNMLKTNYAMELLESTDLNITQIWHKCGFSSHSNFLRLMREETGFSPSEYRKRNKTTSESPSPVCH